jgi:hypothetical protein
MECARSLFSSFFSARLFNSIGFAVSESKIATSLGGVSPYMYGGMNFVGLTAIIFR